MATEETNVADVTAAGNDEAAFLDRYGFPLCVSQDANKRSLHHAPSNQRYAPQLLERDVWIGRQVPTLMVATHPLPLLYASQVHGHHALVCGQQRMQAYRVRTILWTAKARKLYHGND